MVAGMCEMAVLQLSFVTGADDGDSCKAGVGVE